VILVGITLAAVMEAITGTALALGHIDITGALHATPDELAWIDIAYVAAKLTAFVSAAILASRVGMARSLTLGIIGLAATSAVAAATTDLTLMLLWRTLQGAFGGLILVAGQSVLLERFPARHQPVVQAVFAVGAVMAPTTLSPALQGWLVDHLSWSWIFIANVLIGALALLAVAGRLEPAADRTRARRIDWLGLVLVPVIAGCLVYVLRQGSRWEWFEEPKVVYAALVATTGFLVFLVRQVKRQGRGALVDLSVFRQGSFVFAFIVSFVAGAALAGSAFLLPAFFLNVLGYSPTGAGSLLLSGSLTIGAGLMVAGLLIQKRHFAPFKLVPLGILSFMGAMWLLAGSTSESGFNELVPALLLRGVGLGLLFIPITLLALVPLRGNAIAHGVGLFNVGKQVGGLIGVAALQSYLDWQTALNRVVLGAQLTPGSPALAERQEALAALFAARGFPPAEASKAAMAAVAQSLKGQVAVLSFNEAFLALALLFVAVAPLLLALKARLLR
jgi:DHA2 family multidrug resistance protein